MERLDTPDPRSVFSSLAYFRLLEACGLTGSWCWTFASGEQSWSPGLFALLGLEASAVRPSYGALRALAHPADREVLETEVEVLGAGLLRAHTVRIVRPDGSVRTLESRGEIFLDAEGRPAAASGFILDVTDREALADARRAEQRRRWALFREAQSWTHASLYAQAQRVGSRELLSLTGVTQQAFRDDCTCVVAAEDRSRTREHVGSLMRAGRPFEAFKRLVLADGASGSFRFVYVPVRDASGRIESWATLASRVGGIPSAPVDGFLRDELESALGGKHLRAARKMLGWSMMDCSLASGLSFATIRKLEGETEASASSARRRVVAALRRGGIGFSLVDGSGIAIART
ncbi:PAS domain-containing protein [Methylobacterium segetis]|uniref:PAS domain-containing protein n=1 Tax=Methylobacterium segetis TaxID=2488750 RepID=UPI001043351C|nr:PAS domain-containing protein [Methylobacterium segetis]